MYEVVSGLLEVFSAMFQGYCLQYFFGSFLESRIRNRRAGSRSAVWCSAVRDGVYLTKGLHEFLGFHKAGSDSVHRIGGCIGFL